MFKEVNGFEKYSVSNDGSVCGPRGLLKPWIGRGGYLKVCLSKGRKNRRWVYVHRLVCETFHDRKIGKNEINHIDGNKFNNSSKNLEWVTRSENSLHAFRNGLNVPATGERNSSHKLSVMDVHNIRILKCLCTLRSLSKTYGINKNHVCNIQKGAYWRVKEVAHV